MQTKLIEIRDRMTCIVALCIDMNPANDQQRRGLRSAGYPCDGRPNIMVTHVSGERIASNDPWHWKDRTWAEAHLYIIENWPKLVDGSVVDVEFILGETKDAKLAERFLVPPELTAAADAGYVSARDYVEAVTSEPGFDGRAKQVDADDRDITWGR